MVPFDGIHEVFPLQMNVPVLERFPSGQTWSGDSPVLEHVTRHLFREQSTMMSIGSTLYCSNMELEHFVLDRPSSTKSSKSGMISDNPAWSDRCISDLCGGGFIQRAFWAFGKKVDEPQFNWKNGWNNYYRWLLGSFKVISMSIWKLCTHEEWLYTYSQMPLRNILIDEVMKIRIRANNLCPNQCRCPKGSFQLAFSCKVTEFHFNPGSYEVIDDLPG